LPDLPDNLRYLTHSASGPLYGSVYFVFSDPMQLVKIGATNRWEGIWPDVESRVREVRRSVPFVPFTGWTFITPMSLQMSEPELLDFFVDYRVEVNGEEDQTGDNEWFQYTDVLKQFVDEVALLNREHDRYSRESDAYNAHVREKESRGQEPTMPMPVWPDVKPWRHLQTPPTPPSRRVVSFRPVFDDERR
jgi:hypothetical protein